MGEIARVGFPHQFINDAQFGVSLSLAGFGVFWRGFLFVCFVGFFPDWSSSPKSAPQPLCLQLCLSGGELAGWAGMSGCERRRAGSVYSGFSTSKNYSMELHSQQTI